MGWNGDIVPYDGSNWSSMSSGVSVELYEVWGSSSNDVFAVGQGVAILHYNGSSWSSVTSGNLPGPLTNTVTGTPPVGPDVNATAEEVVILTGGIYLPIIFKN